MSKKDKSKSLSDFAERLQNAQNKSGDIIYKDGKALGAGSGDNRNLIKGNKLQKTGDAARAQERLNADKLGKDISVTNPAPDDIDEQKIQLYIEEFIDKDILGEE